MRKAWALYELSKTQGEKLKGRTRAAAALAAYVDPKATNGKHFKEMFPNLLYVEIRNSAQLQRAIINSDAGMTLLLREGYYELYGAMLAKDLQLVALSKGVILKFDTLPIWHSTFYAEGIIFAKYSGSIKCLQKGSLNLFNCQISGGSRCCQDLPECNGGPGCIAVKLAGRKPCDRTGRFGESQPSGIAGNPSIYVIDESTGHVENCDITECGGGGILCEGEGSSLTVKSCRVHRNGQAGLEAREGGRLVAIDNDIYANGFHGILIAPSPNKCEIINNRIYENNKEGILVAYTKNNVVIIDRNRIYHNLAFGISLESCQVEIKGNEIFENNFHGILAKNLTTAIVENNDIYSNKCGGIHIGVNFSGRIVIKSNNVRDHSGPWLVHGDESFYPPDLMASYRDDRFYPVPKGETKIYTLPPVLADNHERNNEEQAFHPKKKIESVQSECAFCRRSQNLLRCSRCNIASYCNSTCQKRHWKKHKALCSALTDQYSVTVEPKRFFPSESHTIRTFGPHLKDIGKGPKPDPKSKQRFIVKVQTGHLNGHPLQNLTVYDKSLSIDGNIQSPEVFHVIMECGVLGQMHKFTSKKAYFYATFADGGKKLNIYLGQLAPYQEW
jgi:hypothetical protein